MYTHVHTYDIHAHNHACMHRHTCIFTLIHVHTPYTHLLKCSCTHTYTAAYIHTHIPHTCIHSHIHYICSTPIYTHSHTHEHTYTHIHTRSHMHTHTTLLYMLMHTYACTCTQYTFRKLCAWLSCITCDVLLSQECHVVEGELEIQLELLLFSPCARQEVFTLGYVPALGGRGELSALGHIILSLCVEFL